ncbi:hypothetical protein IHE44_0012000 [Lamprotornis superbus]|uniref:Cysteine-rich DPF motif domain-containing protein 1 n=1 Tax=Lamprotornis superbus TaxID=245042 RepID=A0A835NW08_9PASS|nr:hypothetical protein IHE44_0012000 [Lamprotornis superbus]
MQQSEVVQAKEGFCLMRVVGKYLDSANGTTNLEEYVPEEIIMAAESVLGHVHAEALGNLKMGAPKEVQTPGEFKCVSYQPHTHTMGRRHQTQLSVVLLEKAYVMKDPITPDKDKFLIVESHCSLCTRAVCVGTDYSLFHSKRFCLPCVKENLNAFPLEIKEDMDKRKPQQKSCKKKKKRIQSINLEGPRATK